MLKPELASGDWPKSTAAAILVVQHAKNHSKDEVRDALTELQQYKLRIGECYDVASERATTIATLTGQPCTCISNAYVGMEQVTAQPGEDWREVRKRFTALHVAARQREIESPEYKQAMADWEAHVIKMHEQMARRIEEIETLDFTDLNAVITWLEQMDGIGSKDMRKQRIVILTALRRRRFVANVNCGAQFDESNKENFARYIIGQAMANNGVIDDRHVRAWREKFGYAING
jgi:hypothetical protein